MVQAKDRATAAGRTHRAAFEAALRVPLFVAALYGFLLGITLMETGFLSFGEGFSRGLISTTANPFIGFLIGLLATGMVQSSSLTTSIIVGMVGAGSLPVRYAIPMVMGANLGTTVTNTLVSLAHITRHEEFRRAFAAATVHDFFNLLTAALLLPIEIKLHLLERAATFLSERRAWLTTGLAFGNPLKPLFRPIVRHVTRLLGDASPGVRGAILLALSGVMLFVCLWGMMRVMKVAVARRMGVAVGTTIGKSPLLGFLVGLTLTAIVQSSSVVTSLLVPLAAGGIFTIEHVFAVTVGANIGTTMTAILASLAAGPAGLTIALVHLLFNVTGTLVFFVPPPMRRLPIYLCQQLTELAMKSKWYVLAYVGGVFLVVPGVCIAVWRLLS